MSSRAASIREQESMSVPAGRRPSPRRGDPGGIPWSLLSRMSPARRAALVVLAGFEIWKVVRLLSSGFQHKDVIEMALGLLVLALLLGFELAEHIAMARDHELAREIAEWLLPHTPPSMTGLEVAFSNRMANHVGSDYFNVFPRWVDQREPDGHCAFIVMADVAGTGLQGALIMATFQASLRVLADARLPLRELADQMNQWTWDRSLQGRHFTMAFIADLDPSTGELRYVLAGHQSPIIRRRDGEIQSLELRGFPLGALADSSYEVGTAVMGDGDTLIVFTDGVVQAENHRGEMYGVSRVVQALRRSQGATAGQIANQLHTSMLSFCGAVHQRDDLSFLVVRRMA